MALRRLLTDALILPGAALTPYSIGDLEKLNVLVERAANVSIKASPADRTEFRDSGLSRIVFFLMFIFGWFFPSRG